MVGGEVRVAAETYGIPVAGDDSADDADRIAVLDARWAEGQGVLKRFGQAFRDRTAEEIEDAVAQAVAEVRSENRRGAEGQAAAE